MGIFLKRLVALLLFALPVLAQHSYQTTFPLTENPMSESGNWSGGANATNWLNARTGTPTQFPGTGNIAYGPYPSGQPSQFADVTEMLTGAWNPNQVASTIVQLNALETGVGHEVELRSRLTYTSTTITGYEFFCNVSVTSTPGTNDGSEYCAIARWNGALGAYSIAPGNCTTSTIPTSGCLAPNWNPADGHRIVNNGDQMILVTTGTNPTTLTGYINGNAVVKWVDNGSVGGFGPWQTGNPGFGFYDGGDNFWYNFGFSYFQAYDMSSSANAYVAATCNPTDINTAFTAEHASAVDTDIVAIPQGSCTWTSTTVVHPTTFTNSILIFGAEAQSATANGTTVIGADKTLITDNLSTSSAAFAFGSTTGKSFRLTNISLQGNGSSTQASNGAITIGGQSQLVRFDHIHIVVPSQLSQGLVIGGGVAGVMDHSFISAPTAAGVTNAIAVRTGNYGNDSAGFGDVSWASPDAWGSANGFYFEDDQWLNGDIGEVDEGARYVIRHSTINSDECAEMYWHGMQTGRSGMGARTGEMYLNNITCPGSTGKVIAALNTGSFLFWGNTSTSTGYRFGLKVAYDFRTTAGGGGNYNYAGNWGYCSPGPTPGTFTVNISAGGVVTGSGFSTGWPINSPIIFNSNKNNGISSTPTSTTFNIQKCDAFGNCNLGYSDGAVSGATLLIASAWDGNFNIAGYPCLHQPGRGQGDLITGSTFPGTVNSTTGIISWPHEKLSPIYSWMNNVTQANYTNGALTAGGDSNTTNNQDYYFECNSINPTCSGGFTGAAGTGFGLHSARPAACTAGNDPTGITPNPPGVAYWETDTSTLFVCTVSGNPGTWTAYYQPLPYPYSFASGTPAATPTYSPTAPYTGPNVSVTISDTTPSSTIFYCTDGTNTCVPSITYSTPVSISSTSYLRAFATAPGFTQSTTASGLYTIAYPAVTYFPPSVSFSPTLVNQSSEAFNIVLQNTGTATLTVSQFGPTNNKYYVVNNTCGTPATLIFGGATASFSLAVSGTCTFSVVYLPQSVNNVDAGGVLAIDNTAGGSDTLILSGIGLTAPAATAQFQ